MSTASDKCQDSLVNRNSNGIFSCTAAILVLFISSLFWMFHREKKNPCGYRELHAGSRKMRVPAGCSSAAGQDGRCVLDFFQSSAGLDNRCAMSLVHVLIHWVVQKFLRM